MMKVTAVSAVGTLAYIIEEEALLVRVNNGWQYIAVNVKHKGDIVTLLVSYS